MSQKCHTMVIMPKPIVINENTKRGPHILTQSVAGNWNVTLATVYTRIDTDYSICFISTYARDRQHGMRTHISIPNAQSQIHKEIICDAGRTNDPRVHQIQTAQNPRNSTQSPIHLSY